MHPAAGVIENLRGRLRGERASDGEQALAWPAGAACALVVLDVMPPASTACSRRPREQGNNTPVLFLTARVDPPTRAADRSWRR